MHNNARIFLVFFIAAVVGTLAHECGHAVVGEMIGYKTRISYAYTYCENCLDIFNAAKNGKSMDVYRYNRMLFTLGGPMQTILTGLAGIIGLLYVRRKQQIDAYNIKHLLLLALSFFWSRFVFNEVFLWGRYWLTGEYSRRGDETKLFSYFDIVHVYGHAVLFIIGCLLLSWITFVLLKKHRLQFIVWGGLGSLSGGLLWLYVIGEYILP